MAKLFLWSEDNFLPSKRRAALLRVKKIVNNISDELKMYGIIETSKLSFKSEMIANDAIVKPIAKDPELPTKILP